MDCQQETKEQALKELQELRQQFNDFLYFLPDALLEIDLLAPRLTYMNRMAYILFGYTETDFAAGIEISRLFAEGEYERAVRIITGYVGDSLSRKVAYARSGKQDIYEFLMRRKDGSVFHAETQTSFVLGEDRIPIRMRTLIRDATARKQVEEALREAQQRFKSAFDNAPNGMALVHLDGRFLQINRSLCELLGRSEEELLGTSFQAITHPDDLDAGLEHLQKMLLGESRTYRTEKRYFHADGRVVNALLSTSLLTDAQGQGLYFVSHVQDITERKRAERELQESEALYRALFETVPVGLGIADRNGNLLAFNEAMLKPGGYTREDIHKIGNVAHLYYDPEERAKALALAQKQDYLDRYEARFKRKDGSCYHTLLSLRPILIKEQPCWQAVVEDITARKSAEAALQNAHAELELRVQERTAELLHANVVLQEQIAVRKRMEESLRHSEERYRAFYEDNPTMYFTVDAQGTILSVNRFGAEQLGYTVAELLGQAVLEVFYEEDKMPAQQHLAACLRNPKQTFHWEFRKIRKDGSLLWVREAARAVQDANGKTLALIVCEDITETKNLRQQAERMERLAALGQLSTTIAHEIRNPLGSISLNFQYLAGRLEVPALYKKTFRNIEQGIARIQNIITGILDFARAAPPALKKTNLHKVLDSSLSLAKHELERAGIRLSKNYQAAHPHVLIDANLMGQVFVNLFLNAKDAMAPGGHLLIHTVSRDDSIKVQIADTGKGIPPENLEKIYDPFFTTKTDGIGLGLAVVARILEQHQAQIFVESKVGMGTTFTVTLPLAREHGVL